MAKCKTKIYRESRYVDEGEILAKEEVDKYQQAVFGACLQKVYDGIGNNVAYIAPRKDKLLIRCEFVGGFTEIKLDDLVEEVIVDGDDDRAIKVARLLSKCADRIINSPSIIKTLEFRANEERQRVDEERKSSILTMLSTHDWSRQWDRCSAMCQRCGMPYVKAEADGLVCSVDAPMGA